MKKHGLQEILSKVFPDNRRENYPILLNILLFCQNLNEMQGGNERDHNEGLFLKVS
jgi:hypothetical protein